MPPLPSWWLSRFVPGVLLMIGALACSRGRNTPAQPQAASASALAATPSVSAVWPAALASGPAQADSAGAPAASAAASASVGAAQGTGPRLDRAVLDKAKGKHALAAYRGFLKALCRTDKGGHRSGGKIEAAERLGLKGADAMSFCSKPDAAGKALASGSFLQAGADEVLLQAQGGDIVAGSSEVLLVMRSDGSSYRFVRYLRLGSTFEVPARITRAGATDIVLLCNHSGRQGVYPGECGFRDLSQFGLNVQEETDDDPDADDEDLRLLSLTICGPSGSVSLGKVTQIEDRIEVRLSVARFVLKPRDADEHGDHCSSDVPGSRSSKEFTMRYAYDGKHLKLETPVPSEAKELLDREW